MTQKILVIDDDLFIREIYVELLRNEGYEVDSAVNGEEGLSKLQQGGYSLTLLDEMMPKLDGLGVLNALHQNPPKIQNGPIILLTNSAPGSIVAEGLKKGAASHLIKVNLNPEQLLSNIKNLYLLDRRNQSINRSDDGEDQEPDSHRQDNYHHRFKKCRQIFNCLIYFSFKILGRVHQRFIKLSCLFTNSHHLDHHRREEGRRAHRIAHSYSFLNSFRNQNNCVLVVNVSDNI